MPDALSLGPVADAAEAGERGQLRGSPGHHGGRTRLLCESPDIR